MCFSCFVDGVFLLESESVYFLGVIGGMSGGLFCVFARMRASGFICVEERGGLARSSSPRKFCLAPTRLVRACRERQPGTRRLRAGPSERLLPVSPVGILSVRAPPRALGEEDKR